MFISEEETPSSNTQSVKEGLLTSLRGRYQSSSEMSLRRIAELRKGKQLTLLRNSRGIIKMIPIES